MAQRNTKTQIRLHWFGRWTLKTATWSYRLGFKIPHVLVKAVVSRSWQVRFGDGEWKSVRVAPDGRVIG